MARYMLTPQDRASRAVNTSLDPNAPDAEIVKAVYEWFRTARAARSPMVNTWNRCYRALRGQQPASVEDWRPNVRVPEIFHLARASVGWKLDQRIVTDISPAAPLGSDWHSFLNGRCRDLEAVMESTHAVNHEEMEYERMLWDADQFGTGILKTTWDPTLAGGLGDGLIQRVNPYCLYPDPAASNERAADYMIEARIMSLQELDRRFPGKGDLFVNGAHSEALDEPPSQLHAPSSTIPRVHPNAVSPGTSALWSTSSKSSPLRSSDPIAVLECWVREHTVTRTGKVIDGWRVIIVAGNHLLFNEKATDLWSHGGHPYDRYVPHDLGEFWGIGLVELLGPIQGALNRILRSVQQNVELTGNPILSEDAGATTQGALLAPNRPGSRMTKRQGKEVKWLEPPRLHPNITELMAFLLDRMKVVSGLNDLTTGSAPSRTASDSIASATEAQFISIRSQLINLEHTLTSAYTKKAALISENYTEQRIISITGPDGTDTPKMLGPNHFMRPSDEGAVPLEYQIRVDAGSASHTSRKVREDKAITLFTLKAIDNMTLLESLDWPNPENVMRRLGLQEASVLAADQPGARQRARAS